MIMCMVYVFENGRSSGGLIRVFMCEEMAINRALGFGGKYHNMKDLG